MKTEKNGKRKDMRNLKKDMTGAANTSKKIAQDKFYDLKTGTKNAANTVGKHIKSAAEKSQNTAKDIKKESLHVAQNVKQAADRLTRRVTSPDKKGK